MKHSNYTLRHPRTMQDAFGPYATVRRTPSPWVLAFETLACLALCAAIGVMLAWRG